MEPHELWLGRADALNSTMTALRILVRAEVFGAVPAAT
jgi:hypothetical protein